MKRVRLAFAALGVCLLAACAERIAPPGPPEKPTPPPTIKTPFRQCDASCDAVNLRVQITTKLVVFKTCLVTFDYNKLAIRSGTTARFVLLPITPGYSSFRFTDSRTYPGEPDGIAIDYGGDPAEFAVGYDDPSTPDKYKVDALPNPTYAGNFYPFVVNVKWSDDQGKTWQSQICDMKDPFIAND